MPTKEQKAKAPLTRVKSAGRISRRLEMLADIYLRDRKDKAVRWVYSPEHKPELSNVISRQADGYAMIFIRDLGDDTVAHMPGIGKDDLVRVGDVVMMSIALKAQQEIQAELDQLAVDERVRVDEEFYEAVDSMELAKGMRPEYKARPRGTSVTELIEKDVDVPEIHKDS